MLQARGQRGVAGSAACLLMVRCVTRSRRLFLSRARGCFVLELGSVAARPQRSRLRCGDDWYRDQHEAGYAAEQAGGNEHGAVYPGVTCEDADHCKGWNTGRCRD